MTDKRKRPALAGNRAVENITETDHSTDCSFECLAFDEAPDVIWFDNNPDRSHRMRDPFPNEIDPDARARYPYAYVVVRQSAPGDRERMFYMTEERLPQFILADEHFAHALFDACGQAVMYGVVPEQLEILHQASLLREGFEEVQ